MCLVSRCNRTSLPQFLRFAEEVLVCRSLTPTEEFFRVVSRGGRRFNHKEVDLGVSPMRSPERSRLPVQEEGLKDPPIQTLSWVLKRKDCSRAHSDLLGPWRVTFTRRFPLTPPRHSPSFGSHSRPFRQWSDTGEETFPMKIPVPPR